MARLWISANLAVLPGKSIAHAKEALQTLAQQTVMEPDCFQFDVLQQHDSPHYFTLWECFASTAALKAHFTMAHTKAYLAKSLTEVISVRYLSNISEVSLDKNSNPSE